MQAVFINNETAEISLNDIRYFSGASLEERTSSGEYETIFASPQGDSPLREILDQKGGELRGGLFISPVIREAPVRPKLPRHELASKKTAPDFQSTVRSLLRFPRVVLFVVYVGMVF
jgi:hypothetical protein